MAATQLTQPMGSEELDEDEGEEGFGGGGTGVHPFLNALLAACESLPSMGGATIAAGGGAGGASVNRKRGGGAGVAAAAAAATTAVGRGGVGGKSVADDGDVGGKSDAARQLVRTLLGHYVARQPPPPTLPLYSLQPPSKSLLVRLTAATTNVFLLPVTVYNMFVRQVKSAADAPAPLADAAVLVLLILVHYTPPVGAVPSRRRAGGGAGGFFGGGGDGGDDVDGRFHPFRAALHGCRDAGGAGSGVGSEAGAGPGAGSVEAAEGGRGFVAGGSRGVIRVSYSDLYETLGLCLVDDRSTLLLYSLLHGGAGVWKERGWEGGLAS